LSVIRLLVVDLDGTLIGTSGEPSVAVRDAIGAATDAGLRIALCTGRPMASCGPIARSLGLVGPHVAFNGALVKVPTQSAAVFRRPLPPDALDRLIELGRREGVCLELYTEETHYVERDWRESRLHAESIRVGYEIASFDGFFGRTDVIKGQIVTADQPARQAAERIAAALAERLKLSVALPIGPAAGMECVNVVDRTVSKGEAVRELNRYYGLSPAEVAGVGDALNDLPMLEAVGWRIAMGNADPALKTIAHFVCADVEHDGLVEAVEWVMEKGTGDRGPGTGRPPSP
jgi:Cof subfamily protein (haloacid dehalogenase superfamily)